MSLIKKFSNQKHKNRSFNEKLITYLKTRLISTSQPQKSIWRFN